MNLSTTMQAGAETSTGTSGILATGMGAESLVSGMPGRTQTGGRLHGGGTAVEAYGSSEESFRANWLRMLKERAGQSDQGLEASKTGDSETGTLSAVDASGANGNAKSRSDPKALMNDGAGQGAQVTGNGSGQFAGAFKSERTKLGRDATIASLSPQRNSENDLPEPARERSNAGFSEIVVAARAGRNASCSTGRGSTKGTCANSCDLASASVSTGMPYTTAADATVQMMVAQRQSRAVGSLDGAVLNGANQPADLTQELKSGGNPGGMARVAGVRGRAAADAQEDGFANGATEENDPSPSDSGLGATGHLSGSPRATLERIVESAWNSGSAGQQGNRAGVVAAIGMRSEVDHATRGAAAMDNAVSAPMEAAPSDAEKLNLKDGNHAPEGAAKLMVHMGAAGEASLSARHAAEMPAAGARAEAPVWMGDSAGMHGMTSPVGIRGHDGSSVAADGAGWRTREAFTAADAGAAPGAPSWIHAGPRRAEAGFEDPELGWVGVRADWNGGSMHASLMPGTAEAAQVLGSHMKGINEYLAEQHAPMTTLTMDDARGGSVGDGAGQHLQQGTGQNAETNESREAQRIARSNSPVADAAAERSASAAGVIEPLAYTSGSRGVHVSVMA